MKTILHIFNLRVNKSCSFMDFIMLLNEKLGKKGYRNIFVFANVQFETVRERIEEKGGSVIVIKKNWGKFFFIKEIFNIIRKWEPVIIDFHFISSLVLLPLLTWLKIFRNRARLVFHYHGEIVPIESLGFINFHFSRLRLLTLFFDKIVTVSKANERFLRALNIKKEVEVIYNGINLNHLTFRNKAECYREHNIPEGDFILTTISTLIPRKGLDILLKASAKVIKTVGKVRLIIVGGGPLEGMCKQLARDLNIENQVIFTGFLEEFPSKILASSDIYVSASNSESFGIVYAEAMAFGVPVVATNVGGIPEVVQNQVTGLLVPPKDENALAQAITTLLTNQQLRKEMGVAGKNRVKELFNIEDKVEELFKKVYGLPIGDIRYG